MFQMIFSGPTAGLGLCIDALRVDGFPADEDTTRQGFPPYVDVVDEEGNVVGKELVSFIEAIASHPDYLERALAVTSRYGYVVRMHGWIEHPVAVN